ncbi:hypothetical protein [Salinispora tropica]|uniref:Uncharacterized protein n=1 Tax=Salinispora tropica (strain ATCC BAA-916 / DSM 44818 / JCM 13857 / NBRC 105044 / CNB-440) TaxID=369723 RepID=A4X283_SALTO|nr:hypothetical protein [Salinispora tropica]ABP52983.1 hypothetical protein Strop_0498 [Salinispora tropica CNB-440]
MSDEDVEAIRRRPAYRAAMWLGRLVIMPQVVPFVVVAIDDDVTVADAVFSYSWLSLVVLAGGFLLLWRAGVPFTRRGWSVETAADFTLNEAMTSDFFFRRR